MKKGIFSVVLLLLMCVFLMSVVMIEAEAATGSTFSDNPVIAERIDKALALYPEGSYFTKNGKACSYHPGSSCGNCLDYVDLNQNHTKDNGEVSLRGTQCMGYARYFQYMLFGDYGLDSSKFNINYDSRSSLNPESTKAWFIKHKDILHPGTHLRVNSDIHSIVILGIDYDKGTVAFVNANIDHHCKVSGIVTYTWAQFASNFKTIEWAAVYKNYHVEYGNNSADIPNGTYYFTNDGYRMYMKNDFFSHTNESVENTLSASNGSVNDNYKFVIVKEGSNYKIYPQETKNGYVVCCFWGFGNGETIAGNKITLYYNEDNDLSQRFWFEECNGGYLIHPADSPDLSWTRNGDVISVEKTTKAANQIWTLDAGGMCSHADKTGYVSDGTTHWRVCNLCGEQTDVATHENKWDNTNPDGHSTVCKICGIAGAFYEHTFDEYIKDEYGHIGECSACGYVTSHQAHHFEIKQNEIEMWRECSTCGYIKVCLFVHENFVYHYISPTLHNLICETCLYSTPTTPHRFETTYNEIGHLTECVDCGFTNGGLYLHEMLIHTDDNGHWSSCTQCDYKTQTESHTWISRFDKYSHWMECSGCGNKTGLASHSMQNCYDSTGHWQACSHCEYQTVWAPHTVVNKMDEAHHWQECTGCQFKTEPMDHNWDLFLTYDQNGHWNFCLDCGYVSTSIPHSLRYVKRGAAGHSQACSDCEFSTGIVSHSMKPYLDSFNHWEKCSLCEYHAEHKAHSMESQYDSFNHWEKCSLCGYSTNPKAHAIITEYDETGHWKMCKECAYKDDVLAHEYTDWEISSSPTCVEVGVKIADCYLCSHRKTEYIDMIDHEYTMEIIEGYRCYTCIVCGTEYQEPIEPEPDTEPETEPETEPDTEPDTEPETEPETEPDTEPETEPDTEPETEPETEPDTVPDTEPNTEPDITPETKPETQESPEANGSDFERIWNSVGSFLGGLSTTAWITLGVGAILLMVLIAILKKNNRRN